MISWGHENGKTDALIVTFFVTLMAVFIAYWSLLGDPFVRHDDYPALFGYSDEFYEKTLSEGRWLNYWWISRTWLWSATTNFYLYLVGWTVFAAAFAVLAVGPSGNWLPRFLLAILVALTPQAYNIAQWYNTLIPGVWLLGIYAVLCLYLRYRVAAALLLVFSPLTFSAYSTYPFVLLATLMARHDADRSMRNWALTVLAFIASFALSMLAAYFLNWLNHGIFGISVGDWRNPNPLETWGDLRENLALIVRFVSLLLQSYGMGQDAIGYGIYTAIAIGFFLLFLADRRDALFAITPIALGLGLLCVHTLTTGVSFPVRATLFVWLGASYVLVKVTIQQKASHIALGLSFGLVALVCYLEYQFVRNNRIKFVRWQEATAQIAAQIPVDAKVVYVFGERFSVDGAANAGIQTDAGLRFRLSYLTGVPVTVCHEVVGSCDDVEPPFSLTTEFQTPHVQREGDLVFLRLPPLVGRSGP